LLRTATSGRRCVGAKVDVIDATKSISPGSGRYSLLPTSGDPGQLPRMSARIVLDSNVVIDLERAAKGRKVHDLGALQALVIDLLTQDVIPGLGISESSWFSESNQHDDQIRKSLLAAMDAWFDHGMEGVLDLSDLKARWKLHYVESTQLPSHRSPSPGPWVRLFYVSFLKLDQLWSQVNKFKANQRVDLFGEYCRFVSEDLQMVSAHALQVAHDRLIGPGAAAQYTDKLLKFSKTAPLARIRAAAWDLFFVFFSELMHDQDGGAEHVLLATADGALPNLRRRLQFAGMINVGESKLGLMVPTLDIDRRLEHRRQDIADAYRRLDDSVTSRFASTAEDIEGVIAELEPWVARLEDEVRKRP
jgi:hypothetical protein